MRYLIILVVLMGGCKSAASHLEIVYEQRLPEENAVARVAFKLDGTGVQ